MAYSLITRSGWINNAPRNDIHFDRSLASFTETEIDHADDTKIFSGAPISSAKTIQLWRSCELSVADGQLKTTPCQTVEMTRPQFRDRT